MKRLLLVSLLSTIALLLISCGGNSGGGASPSNTAPGTGNAAGCDNTTNASCTTLMVTQSDGTTVARYYTLYIPPNFPASSGALVVMLHGTGESALEYPTHTLMSATADANGFALVYPEALDAPRNGNLRQWNYFFNGDQSPTDSSPDDVAFIRQLITTLQPSLNADPKRIYVQGISAGGLMAVRVGVELSNLVAAIAPISGALDNVQGTTDVVPAALGPVSAIMLHADMDTLVPYCGDGDQASQDATFNYWITADGITNLDTTTSLCTNGSPTNINEKDGTNGLQNTEVKFYRLIGAGHFTVYYDADLSSFNPNFNTTTGTLSNDIVWKFFAAHPKP
jgi:polyhydroxybutyrate depolymerase